MHNSILLLKRALSFLNNLYVNRIVFLLFVYIKKFRKQYCYLYINENYNDCHQRITAYTFLYIQKEKEIVNLFYIQKSRHFAKSKTICVTFLYTKSKTLYVTRFFMKLLGLGFIYKKHEKICYVMFYIQKPETSQKVR